MSKLTKADLEDIWNNKPVGYVKKYIKDMKGKAKYKVTWTPFTEVRTYQDPIEEVVYAKTRKLAEKEASYMLRIKLMARGLGQKYTFKIEEVK